MRQAELVDRGEKIIQQNRWVLWKIHGDRNDPRTRVLSAEDYETHYLRLDHLLSGVRAQIADNVRIRNCYIMGGDSYELPDQIAARLAGDNLFAWIVDEPGIQDRNAILACVPEKQLHARSALNDVIRGSHERWSIRRRRLRGRDPALDSRHW